MDRHTRNTLFNCIAVLGLVAGVITMFTGSIVAFTVGIICVIIVWTMVLTRGRT